VFGISWVSVKNLLDVVQKSITNSSPSDGIVSVTSRPATSLGHQGREEFSEEVPKTRLETQ